jgi:hypothetical protein
MFYAQCDNIGSMYKLAVKVIDDVNSACAGDHLHSHGIYFYSAAVFHCEISLKSGKNPTAPHILS